jgi:hypothetical protein
VKTTEAVLAGVLLSALVPAVATFLFIDAVASGSLGWPAVAVIVVAIWAVGLAGIRWLVAHRLHTAGRPGGTDSVTTGAVPRAGRR